MQAPGLKGADTAGKLVLQEQSGNAPTITASNVVLRAVPNPIFDRLLGCLVGRALGSERATRATRYPSPPWRPMTAAVRVPARRR